MNKPDDLNALKETWQSVAPVRPTLDLPRRRRAQRVHLAIEASIAAFGVVAGVLLMFQGSLLIGLATLLYSLFGGLIARRTRLKNIDILGRATRDYLAAHRTILKTRRNYCGSGVAMCVAALIFFVFVRWQQDSSVGALDVVIASGLMLGAVLFMARTWWTQRRLGRLEALRFP